MNYLPKIWKDKLYEYTKARVKCNSLIFKGGVTILFEDNSIAKFENAFAITDHQREIGVFTKNCGNHIFDSRSITTITAS